MSGSVSVLEVASLPPVHSGQIMLFILMKGTLQNLAFMKKLTFTVFRQDPIYVYVYMSLHIYILYHRITWYVYIIYTHPISGISTHFRRFVSTSSLRSVLPGQKKKSLACLPPSPWSGTLWQANHKNRSWRNMAHNERLQLQMESRILMSYISLKDVTSPSTLAAKQFSMIWSNDITAERWH